MPRDTPPIALPALRFTDAAAGALRYGGYPRLPARYDWPYSPSEKKPMNFLAEIDLDALPREMSQAGHDYTMPECPRIGKLFLFLPLWGDMIYQNEMVVIHAPDANETTPERQPPEPIHPFDMDALMGIHGHAVAVDGCSLKTGHMTADTFLSHRAENTLWRNMDRSQVSAQEIYARDKAFADQLNALGIDYDVPLPTHEAATEPLFEDIPQYYQGFFSRGTFQWDWAYIFEFSKVAHALCHNYPVEELEGEIEDGNDHPRHHKEIAKAKARKTAILAERYDGKAGWWESYSCDHIPSLDMRIDVQFRRWMGYARYSRARRALTEQDKAAFVEMLKLVTSWEHDDSPANLRCMAKFHEHSVRKSFIELTVSDAFKHVATALQNLHPERALEPKNDFGEADAAARHVQMFGLGYLCQHAAVEHEDKVLLFQISDACGIEFTDGLMQLWISHEDLAAARFDKVICTKEST